LNRQFNLPEARVLTADEVDLCEDPRLVAAA
jgi:hypothetical protein